MLEPMEGVADNMLEYVDIKVAENSGLVDLRAVRSMQCFRASKISC